MSSGRHPHKCTNDVERRILQADEQGSMARRAGKKRGDCPFRGDTDLVRSLSQAWHRGWERADMKRKADASSARASR